MNTTDQISMMLFSGERCGICQALKPKLQAISEKYPAVELTISEPEKEPELAARHTVFSVPTLLIFAEGKEYRRYHGAFSLNTVQQDLERLIRLMTP